MAGSLRHIQDNKTGEFTMEYIENIGDAHEALAECFEIIKHLTGGKIQVLNPVLNELKFCELKMDMT